LSPVNCTSRAWAFTSDARSVLVATRRDGKRIYYSVADPRALALLKKLYDLYCPAN
jgi:DNA-binding transcriptional ArsR family regulator